MMRNPCPPGAVLAILMLTASAGWSQEAATTEEPSQDAAAEDGTADAAATPAEETPEATADTAGGAATATAEAGEAGAAGNAAVSDDPNLAVASEENGRYFTADGVPTFNISEDGTVDWLTYSGFRRYHAECHVCHGPDGEGSSYAPALKNSAINLDYYEFVGIVAGGRQNVDAGHTNVMPAFGDNFNVMCYVDDIYVYLKARGAGVLPRGRPGEREDKSDAIREAEETCLGT